MWSTVNVCPNLRSLNRAKCPCHCGNTVVCFGSTAPVQLRSMDCRRYHPTDESLLKPFPQTQTPHRRTHLAVPGGFGLNQNLTSSKTFIILLDQNRYHANRNITIRR